MVKKVEKIWLDGRVIPWEEANVHILTHTLHYGVGVFEGIRCYRTTDGRSAIFRLRDHIGRFFESAHSYQMEIPYQRSEIEKVCAEMLRVNGMKEGYIRPLAFLGEGSVGVLPSDNPVRVAVAVWEWGSYLGEGAIENGIRAKVSSFTRMHVNASMVKAKVCGQYTNSVLAKKEAKELGFDEAIVLDTEGYVAEGTGENIFMFKNGVLKTPQYSSSILGGITRGTIISLAEDAGIKIEFSKFTRDELYNADEAFFVGTAAEVTPIREVDFRKIGNGRPGPVTKNFQETYFKVVRGEIERYRHWLTHLW